MRRRAAFTLIEVLIAVVLVDVGLLALVAAGSILVRRTAELRLQTAATRTAVDRLQLLGVGGCVATSGMTTSALGIREYWETSLPSAGVHELFDSVTFAAGGVEKTVVLRTRLPC